MNTYWKTEFIVYASFVNLRILRNLNASNLYSICVVGWWLKFSQSKKKNFFVNTKEFYATSVEFSIYPDGEMKFYGLNNL